ncbi:tRNA (N6-isopentenyl adenosine(37)-C2)-methylthiotransferase MiaB [bacterium]|nr:MAG: tRNA (N6-isopentenyl adenosine(37)-C2)-methylthiotransferase MiaB [bacterium]
MPDTLIEEINSEQSIDSLRQRLAGGKKKLYLETYGCQMNVYDSELVASIMHDLDYDLVDQYDEADAIFMNTCAIRENAEQRVWGQLTRFKKLKEQKPDLIIGVLGCMAKHLENEIHDKRPYVNVVLGPDSYKKLPDLLRQESKKNAPVTIQKLKDMDNDFSLSEFRDFKFQIDTRLSRTEVYEEIEPARFGKFTAWIAIMRGCDNFCTFCVVPYTRGRERSRSVESVVEEAKKAVDQGYTEICLLGQNVNSYKDNAHDFAFLMEKVSDVKGIRRVRFTSPHPKDFPERLLYLIAERDNICKHLHMPVQSGSDRILYLMNRTYTRDEYFTLIDRARKIIPDVALTTDVITGFPSETEQDHKDTLSLFERVQFDAAYTFKYSPRIGTKAYAMPDDVSEELKSERLHEIMELQRIVGEKVIRREIGKELEVLVEMVSRKSEERYCTKTGKSQTVIIPRGTFNIGDYVNVKITRSDGHTLFGEPV